MVPGIRIGRCAWGICLLLLAAIVGGGIVRMFVSAPADETHELPPPAGSRFLNASPDVGYVGSAACADCHTEQYESYLQTGHSRALADVDLGAEPEGGEVEHAASGRKYRIDRKDGRMWHREFARLTGGREILLAEHPMRYIIGSGRFSRSYLIEDEGFLMESPVTWYEARPGWGMSPGYETFNSGFERPAETRCVICHVGRVEPIGGSPHRLQIHEQAISCERCHGPGEAHVAQWSQSDFTLSGADRTIVHPGRLTREEKEAICAQCHLHSAASVEVRGRQLADFRPGGRLTDFQVAYGFDSSDSAMTVVGHIEQLRLSACYRKSETLTCTTCHNPHAKPDPAESFAAYKAQCVSCHQEQPCKLEQAERLRRSARDDCVGCHMPQSPTDIPHFAFTHHRIAVHGSPASQAEPQESPPSALVPLDDVSHLPDIDQDRNLGLAYLQAAAHPEHLQHGAYFSERARELLASVKERGLQDPEVDAALARVYWGRDPERSIELAQSALRAERPSPDARATALFVLGTSLYELDRLEEALPVLEEMVTVRRYGDGWSLLSDCRFHAGDLPGALEAARQAVRISPHRSDLHLQLADLYHRSGDAQRAAEHRTIGEQLHPRRP